MTALCASVGAKDTLGDLGKQLDLPELQRCAMAFTTGRWHPGAKKVATRYPALVDALPLAGKSLPGPLPSYITVPGSTLGPCIHVLLTILTIIRLIWLGVRDGAVLCIFLEANGTQRQM